jgi:hypothetical protein
MTKVEFGTYIDDFYEMPDSIQKVLNRIEGHIYNYPYQPNVGMKIELHDLPGLTNDETDDIYDAIFEIIDIILTMESMFCYVKFNEKE